MKTIFHFLQRALRFWLESLGQLPGLTHDAGLPVWSQIRGGASGGVPRPGSRNLSPDAQRLADEMTWGSSLRPDDDGSVIRSSM